MRGGQPKRQDFSQPSRGTVNMCPLEALSYCSVNHHPSTQLASVKEVRPWGNHSECACHAPDREKRPVGSFKHHSEQAVLAEKLRLFLGRTFRYYRVIFPL